MRVIFGIGNPGNAYLNNRHNVGFLLLDYIASKYSNSFNPSKGDYYFCNGKIDDSEFSLIKPTTYVNNSGIAASQALQFYNINPSDFLIVYDDINLNFATVRVRASGGDGGHNGIGSIIYHLQTDKFPRIRIGIGSNFEKGFMANYVLTDFNKDELQALKNTFEHSVNLIEEFVKGGVKQLLDANSKFSQATSRKE